MRITGMHKNQLRKICTLSAINKKVVVQKFSAWQGERGFSPVTSHEVSSAPNNSRHSI